MNTQKKNLG